MRMSAKGGSASGGHPNLRIQKLAGINIIVFILFIADRILKYYFIENPAGLSGGVFISGWLDFQLEKNYGIAFGLPVGGWALMLVVIIIIFILVGYLIKSWQKNDSLMILALALIIGGAVSNLIDRLRFGFVIDYIDVPWFTIFNLADIMITVGVGLAIVKLWFKGEKAVRP